jgi:hypothetical protein
MSICKGSIMTITEGEYSDFTIHGTFTVLRDIDPDAVEEAFMKAHPDEDRDCLRCLGMVTRFLIDAGYVEKLETSNLHLGDYGCMNLSM